MEIKVNRDIRKYRPVILGNLTIRQTVVGIITCVTAIIIAFSVNLPIETLGLVIVILCAPIAAFILEEIPIFNLPLEKVLPLLLLYLKTSKHSTLSSHYYTNKPEKEKYKNMTKGKYRIPKSIQDMIPLDEFYKDGMARKGNRYSVIYRFTDIDFSILSDENKKLVLANFEELISSFKEEAEYKLTIKKQKINGHELYKDLKYPEFNSNPDITTDMNYLLFEEISNKNAIYNDLLLTVTVFAKNEMEAHVFFNEHVDIDVISKLSELQSSVKRLSIYERIKLYFDIVRVDENDVFAFSDVNKLRGMDVKDYCCPSKWIKHSSYLEVGNKYVRTLYLQTIDATAIPDKFLNSLTENIENLSITSLCIKPIAPNDAERLLNISIASSKRKISGYKQAKAKKLEITDEAPPAFEQEYKDCKEIYDDYHNREQKLYSCTVLVTIYADSLEELETSTTSLKNKARLGHTSFENLFFQQIPGYFSCLPFGTLNAIDSVKTLTTESIAAFVPFTSQIIQNRGSKANWIGSNPVSHKVNSIDRSNLYNGNGLILGVSGSGKSVQAKLDIIQRRIKEPEDCEIVILDPQGEYSRLVKALGGITVNVSAGSPDHINIMEYTDNYGSDTDRPNKSDPIRKKIAFIQTYIAELYTDAEHQAQIESIINRCCMDMYKDYIKHDKDPKYVPTLKGLWVKLRLQPEDIVEDICLALEQYCNGGALDMFSYLSNIPDDDGLICYDLSEMEDKYETLGLMVMLDQIFNRIARNHAQGKYTYVYIDEFHKFFGSTAETFIMDLWRMGRKLHVYSTGITQNISDMMDNPNGKKIIEGSEYHQILKCGNISITEDLARLINCPAALLKYIQGEKNPEERSRNSTGIIKYSGTIIPFESEIPEESYLYSLINTD